MKFEAAAVLVVGSGGVCVLIVKFIILCQVSESERSDVDMVTMQHINQPYTYTTSTYQYSIKRINC